MDGGGGDCVVQQRALVGAFVSLDRDKDVGRPRVQCRHRMKATRHHQPPLCGNPVSPVKDGDVKSQ